MRGTHAKNAYSFNNTSNTNNAGNTNNTNNTGNKTYNYSEAQLRSITPFLLSQILEVFIMTYGFGNFMVYLIVNQVQNRNKNRR